MNAHDLFKGLNVRTIAGSEQQPVTDLTDDSRLAKPGCLFIARGGTKKDGHDFIHDALQRGATAILTDGKITPGSNTPGSNSDSPIAWFQTDLIDNRLLAELAERFFDRPSRKLKLLGVTGTNGKTTTVFLAQHLLASQGLKTGLIGTVLIDDGATRRESELTTPGAIEISRILAAMVRNGCRAAVMETSSHALHQGRISALDFDVAGFTNLTGDHLDYHGSMENYAAAKAILFENLRADATAVVNVEDAWAARMVRDTKAKFFSCAITPGNSAATNPTPSASSSHHPSSIIHHPSPCTAHILELGPDFSRVRFEGPWGTCEVKLPLVGRHNVMNTLQAIVCVHAIAPFQANTLRDMLTRCPAPPGRLEPVVLEDVNSSKKTPAVLVDYAHTHDALQNVLSSLRPLTKGKLITVFGCGGDRDRTKRPKMAAVACAMSDLIYVTSDNPRTEDPQFIITEILAGVPQDKSNHVLVEPDRAAAIARAIADAGADDVVLLAGKGHENYQIIGTTKRHFDDREQAALALRAWSPPGSNPRIAGSPSAGSRQPASTTGA